MATTENRGTEELIQAYNRAISSGFAAMDAGMVQATAAVKAVTDAVEKERAEYGKVVEKTVSHARSRSENLVNMMPAIFQAMTTIPAAGTPRVSAEDRESFGKFLESETAFYQSWTKDWVEYVAGMEERRSAAVKSLLEGNARAMASGQEVASSVAKCGEALLDWSLSTVTAAKS